MKKQHLILILVGFVALYVLAVSSGVSLSDEHPSHSNALAQIKAYEYNIDLPNNVGLKPEAVELTDFKYINGYRKDDGYIVAADWTGTMRQSFEQVRQAAKEDVEKRTGYHIDGPGNSLTITALKIVYGDFVVGAKFQMGNKFKFIRTENGWQIEGLAK